MGDDYEYERAKLLLKRKIMVHCSTHNFFANGILLEVSEKHFVIKDRKDGAEKFVFFEELKKPLEPYNEVGK